MGFVLSLWMFLLSVSCGPLLMWPHVVELALAHGFFCRDLHRLVIASLAAVFIACVAGQCAAETGGHAAVAPRETTLFTIGHARALNFRGFEELAVLTHCAQKHAFTQLLVASLLNILALLPL